MEGLSVEAAAEGVREDEGVAEVVGEHERHCAAAHGANAEHVELYEGVAARDVQQEGEGAAVEQRRHEALRKEELAEHLLRDERGE